MHVDEGGERSGESGNGAERKSEERNPWSLQKWSAPGNGGEEARRRETSQPGGQGRLLGGGDSGGGEEKQGKSIMSKGKNRNRGGGMRTSLLCLGNSGEFGGSCRLKGG